MEARPLTILCIDDDPSTLELRKLLLRGAGYHVLTAPSAANALQILADETDVDLVLLDYLMPGMNGDELASQLRQRHPSLPLVVVSAIGQLPPKLLNSVDSHVQKGQPPEVLLSVISAVLGRSASPHGSGPRKIVLCVEDEDLQLHFRKMQFEFAGFRVLQAQSASAAMEIFRSHHVDAVVMDYWLSGTNGTAVAEEMKQLSPRTPIVMLSGFSSLPGEGAVVDAWLRKVDVGPEEVVNEVRRLIDRTIGTQPTATS
jgi:two-component system, OmpR family, response regulator CpxR